MLKITTMFLVLEKKTHFSQIFRRIMKALFGKIILFSNQQIKTFCNFLERKNIFYYNIFISISIIIITMFYFINWGKKLSDLYNLLKIY